MPAPCQRRRFLCALLLLALALSAGSSCRGRDDLDGRRRALPGLAASGEAFAIERQGARPVFDFYDNRAAAVVHAEGALVISCGTADVVKYVDGAYGSPWHLHAALDGRRAALVDGLAGELYLPLGEALAAEDAAAQGGAEGSLWLSIDARAAKPEQLVSVFLNERRLGDISMPKASWQRYQIEIPAGVAIAGENKLRFYFRHTDELPGLPEGARSAAAIARIGVGPKRAPEGPVLVAGPAVRGGKRLDALQVAQRARLSYYVQVPEGAASLGFAYAGPAAAGAGAGEEGDEGDEGDEGERAGDGEASGVAMSVSVTREGQAPALLWQGRGRGAGWAQATASLAEYAGEIVRLDFSSAGAAAWGRPELRVAAAAQAERAEQALARADHVLVWVVSALRGDRVHGSAVPTPGFGHLAERGVDFTQARTSSPVAGPAHVAMLQGRAHQGHSLPAGGSTLAERMRHAGYFTGLISGNGFVNDEAGFARGFTVYENPMRRRHPFHARVLWQRVKRLLQRHAEGRTFLYVVTVEPHLPYRPSEESLAAEWARGAMRFEGTDTIALSESVAAGTEKLTAEERDYVGALYDGEVRDADEAFAAMLEELDAMGIGDRTAVILVGDHGEELWERGGFGHGGHLFQEVLHVPLVIAPPAAARARLGGQRVTRAVSTVDLVPTILALAGLPADPGLPGRDLLALALAPPPTARPIYAHIPGRARSVELAGHKLHVPLHGSPSLYDLEADPGELRDRFAERPLSARFLRNAFGIGVAYEQVWSHTRWGQPANVRPAFPADQGL
ncbi:sulfatase-like hydrolase/transferase [Haliangium ochraceum]|uniref:Sulfatase n=1 Tax=Haliangium ochraceum (strain DSM 14365 / JCM 11303 / SMP-2) TaxID=502025 RepID=D0LKU6_HALO1|nr:sulfatase-like hydrolase/transferase [Haliangium ochraceum]ACY16666.1 sulfatase [Haliangium ochraceum DSM 14365]